jgi:hypothetical protein
MDTDNTLTGTIWTDEDERAANAEGWCISNDANDADEIQRLDGTGVFDGDPDAIAWVYWKATAGSALHRKALFYTLREGNVCREPSPRKVSRA